MEIHALDHIVLSVTDVERSLAFYRDVLGLPAERVELWREGKVGFPSLRVNGATIIDLQRHERTGENLNHFCLVSAGTIDGVVGELRGHGVEIEGGPRNLSGARGNADGVYIRDPDGNMVEIRCYES